MSSSSARPSKASSLKVIATSADTRRLAVFFPPYEEQTNQQTLNDSAT
jgi:hypothetical protein